VAKVTVYILNYNYEKYLSKAIESVLSQSFHDIEVLLIDDGSTDNSLKIIEKYANDLTIVRQKNIGLTKSIKKAFTMASGEYVVRLDADDWMDPQCIEMLVQKIEISKNIGLVFPDYFEVDEAGHVIRRIKRHDFAKNVTLFDQPAHGACTMIRKEYYFEVGGNDDNYKCQDGVDIWLSLTEKYDVLNVTEPLFYYRKHSQSLTTNEGRILETRGQIYKDHAQRRGFEHNETHAFIPVRSQKMKGTEYALMRLGSKSVIEWVALKARVSELVTKVVIMVDDEQLRLCIHELFCDDQNVSVVSRAYNDSSSGVSLRDSVRSYLLSCDGLSPETIVILTLDYPFSRYNYIDTAIYSMFLFDSNSVDSVVMDNSIFYFHDGKGLKSWTDIHVRKERDDIYLRRGGVSVFHKELLDTNCKVISQTMGHVIIDKISSFEVRSHEDIAIANFIAGNFLLENAAKLPTD
jgi:glycosyltransferase involved in cell wall biosynthesis